PQRRRFEDYFRALESRRRSRVITLAHKIRNAPLTASHGRLLAVLGSDSGSPLGMAAGAADIGVISTISTTSTTCGSSPRLAAKRLPRAEKVWCRPVFVVSGV